MPNGRLSDLNKTISICKQKKNVIIALFVNLNNFKNYIEDLQGLKKKDFYAKI